MPCASGTAILRLQGLLQHHGIVVFLVVRAVHQRHGALAGDRELGRAHALAPCDGAWLQVQPWRALIACIKKRAGGENGDISEFLPCLCCSPYRAGGPGSSLLEVVGRELRQCIATW
jgi:hypothetical protein